MSSGTDLIPSFSESAPIEVRNDQLKQENAEVISNKEVWSSSGSGSGTTLKENKDTAQVASAAVHNFPPIPKFKTISDELKWKFNKARDSLKKAKQYVAIAELTAAKKHRGTKNEKEVKDIITKTEVALVHAGDKMGLDYVHYKRSIDDEDE